ncbi:DnaB-like helicase N-terminal domain-containing protein [Actinoplanes sp. NPDC051861]|uniref:replicative DNA helicase n=1 Tax=Actinoplanes sp. NPDC051861 TaxID=3155170 RepID=UPI00343628A5
MGASMSEAVSWLERSVRTGRVVQLPDVPELIEAHPPRTVTDAEDYCYLALMLHEVGAPDTARQLLTAAVAAADGSGVKARLRNFQGVVREMTGDTEGAANAMVDAAIDLGKPADDADRRLASVIMLNRATLNTRLGRDRQARQAATAVGAELLSSPQARLAVATLRHRLANPALRGPGVSDELIAVGSAATGLLGELSADDPDALLTLVVATQAVYAELAASRTERDLRPVAEVLQIAAQLLNATVGITDLRAVRASFAAAVASLEADIRAGSTSGARAGLSAIAATLDRIERTLGIDSPISVVARATTISARFLVARTTGDIRIYPAIADEFAGCTAELELRVGAAHPQTLVARANWASVEMELARLEGSAPRAHRAAGLLEIAVQRSRDAGEENSALARELFRESRACMTFAAGLEAEGPRARRAGAPVLVDTGRDTPPEPPDDAGPLDAGDLFDDDDAVDDAEPLGYGEPPFPDDEPGPGEPDLMWPADAAASQRRPLVDVAAEQSVLGAMLLSKDAIADAFEIVSSRDFSRPGHELIFHTIADLYARGEPADTITVAAAMADAGELAQIGGAAYLNTVTMTVPTAANVTYYARTVAHLAIRRRLREAGDRIGALAEQPGDVEALAETALETLYENMTRPLEAAAVRLDESIPATLDVIEAAGAAGESRSATAPRSGVADLDVIMGPLQPGALTVIAGPEGSGAPELALTVARHVSIAQGMTTAYFSTEVRQTDLVMRVLSAETGVPLLTMRAGELDDDQWTRLARRLSEISAAPLFVQDSPGSGPLDIQLISQYLRRRHELALVVVDSVERPGVLAGLKQVAVQMNCAVLAVYRLSGGKRTRNPYALPKDVRGSADVAIRVLRQADPVGRVRGSEASLVVVRNRFGPVGTAVATADLERCRFVNREPEPAGEIDPGAGASRSSSDGD